MPCASNRAWLSKRDYVVPSAYCSSIWLSSSRKTTVDRLEKVTIVIWCLCRDKQLQALSCSLVNSIWYRYRFVPWTFHWNLILELYVTHPKRFNFAKCLHAFVSLSLFSIVLTLFNLYFVFSFLHWLERTM